MAILYVWRRGYLRGLTFKFPRKPAANEIRLILRGKKVLRKRNGKEKKNFGENAKIVRRNEKVVERQARAALCRSTSKIRTKDKSGV